MAILVTGASGFVGLNCIEHLLAGGHTVVGVADNEIPAAVSTGLTSLPGAFRFALVDVRDVAVLTDVMVQAGVAAVIHAAAVTAGPERERSEADWIVDVNVRGTQAVLDASRAASVRRVVYVSSAAVYGAATFCSDPIDEGTIPEPRTLYAITKLAGEHLMRRHGELHGTEVVAARLSAIYGPWERDTGVRDFLSPMYQLARVACRGGSIALPEREAGRNWLYSRDAAEALGRLAAGPPPQHFLYNVAPASTFRVSAWAARLEAVYQGFTTAVENSGRPTLHFDADPARSRAPVENARLRAELVGWPRYSPDRAFNDYVSWLDVHPTWV